MKDNINVRRSVCEAGLRLTAEGLVARTWGNISIRIDDSTMAVTPSGIRYEDIKPEHVAVMDINTGKWECRVKPSGERKLHAAIYRARPEIGAVIHTHQINASVCAAARTGVEINKSEYAKLLRSEKIHCGGYGLPGTGKLTKETVAALRGGMCALMANHGAVCLGRDIEEAFEVAKALESICALFISEKITSSSGGALSTDESVCRHYINMRMNNL